MTVQTINQRDTRIDVFRALALITIFINHVPGTVFEYLTHRNFGFSDSAEAFVLISGMAVALAYGKKFEAGNHLVLTLKMMRRTATLYVAHIMTTLGTLVLFIGAAIFLKKPQFLEQINIKPLIDKPAEALFGLITLGHQLGYNNILSLYAILLLMAPALLFLARKSLSLMLAVSATVWFLAGLYNIAPPNFPNAGVWFLNPFSWQLIFAIGIAGIMYIRSGKSLPANPFLIAAALIYLTLSFFWVRLSLWNIDISMGLPRFLTGFDKTYLSGPRLLHVIALAYLIAVIPQLNTIARTAPDHPLAILGKHSLPIFIAGTLLALSAQILKQLSAPSMIYDALLLSTGIALQFALAYYLEWLPRIGWSKSKVTGSVPAQPAPARSNKVVHSAKIA